MSHLRAADGTVLCEHDENHGASPPALALAAHEHHEHEHGLVDRSILRSRAGIRAVSWSLAVLTATGSRRHSSTRARSALLCSPT